MILQHEVRILVKDKKRGKKNVREVTISEITFTAKGDDQK